MLNATRIGIIAMLAGTPTALAGDVPTFTPYPGTGQIIDISDDGTRFISFGFNLSLWINGVETVIGDENTESIIAISGDGSTVIGTVVGEGNLRYAGRWTEGGGWENLGDLGLGGCDFNRSSGYNCSDDGSVVVGLGWDGCTGVAFVYTDDAGMQPLPNSGGQSARANAIAENDVVAGWNGNCRKAAFWDDWGDFETMPGGGTCGEFYDILDDGSVIVGEDDFEATYWEDGTGLVGLGFLDDGVGTRAFGISDDGSVIVGQSGDFFNGYKAFMWTEETGMVDLRNHIIDLGVQGQVPLLTWANSVAVTDSEIIITGASGSPPFTEGYTVSIPIEGCYADFDGDGQLTILDFVAYQNAFTAGDLSADCDGDGELTILDFVCFQNAFTTGC